MLNSAPLGTPTMEGIMRPTTNRLLSASIGLGALGLVAVASVQSGAAPPVTPPVQLQHWIQSTPNRAMAPCPLSAPAATADVPFFAFAPHPMASCLLAGPFDWSNHKWYVQHMQGVVTAELPTPHEVLRVCTADAVRDDGNVPFEGPCRTKNGVGPHGCEVCRIADIPEK
jgi:hypothetical protein